MSSARVAMAHDWKIAEAAWLHSAAKNGKRFGSEGSSLAFFPVTFQWCFGHVLRMRFTLPLPLTPGVQVESSGHEHDALSVCLSGSAASQVARLQVTCCRLAVSRLAGLQVSQLQLKTAASCSGRCNCSSPSKWMA